MADNTSRGNPPRRHGVLIALVVLLVVVFTTAVTLRTARADGASTEASTQTQTTNNNSQTASVVVEGTEVRADNASAADFSDSLASKPTYAQIDRDYGQYERHLLPDALAKQSDLNNAASDIAGYTVSDAVAYGYSGRDLKGARDYVYRHVLRHPGYAKMLAEAFSIIPLRDGTYIGANSWAVKNVRVKWNAALSVEPNSQDLSGLECFIVNSDSSDTGYDVTDAAFYDAGGLLNILDGFKLVEINSGYQNLLNFNQQPTDYLSRRVPTLANYQERTDQVWIVFGLFDKNGDSLIVDNGEIGTSRRKVGKGDGETVYLGVNVKDGRIGILKKAPTPAPRTPSARSSAGRASASSSYRSGGNGGGGSSCQTYYYVTRVDQPSVTVTVVDNSSDTTIIDNSSDTTIVDNSTTVIDNSSDTTIVDNSTTIIDGSTTVIDNSSTTVDNSTTVVNIVNNIDESTTIINNDIDNSTTIINDNDTSVVDIDNNTTTINDNDTNVTDIDITDIDITDIDVTDIDITDIDVDITPGPPTPPDPPTPPTPSDEEKDPNLDPVNNGNADQGGGQNQPTDGSGNLEPTDPANDQTQGHQDPETTYPDTPAPDVDHADTVIDNTNETPMNYEPVIDDSQTWTDPETGASTTYEAPPEGMDYTPDATEHGEFNLESVDNDGYVDTQSYDGADAQSCDEGVQSYDCDVTSEPAPVIEVQTTDFADANEVQQLITESAA